MVREFVKELVDLYVKKNISLPESLKIMGNGPGNGKGLCKRKRKLEKSALFLYESLEKGVLLSHGFYTCPFIDFDGDFVKYISLGEKTGDLRKTMVFLDKKYERHFKNRVQILEASVYPVFVVILTVSVSLFLCDFAQMSFEIIGRFMFFLLLLIFCIFFGVRMMLKENQLYEIFLTVDFLLNSGTGINDAVKIVAELNGKETKIGRSLVDAGEKLEYGMSFQKAFSFGEQFREGFYLADRTGGEKSVFGKLAENLEEQYERKRKMCFTLLEPVLLCFTGVFLLLVIMKVFIPVLNNFDFI